MSSDLYTKSDDIPRIVFRRYFSHVIHNLEDHELKII